MFPRQAPVLRPFEILPLIWVIPMSRVFTRRPRACTEQVIAASATNGDFPSDRSVGEIFQSKE